MRKYVSETDYPLILRVARHYGVELAPIKVALEAAGIEWPSLQDNYGNHTPEQDAMSDEIMRAWRECGYCK